MTVYCPKCGAANEDFAEFCASCGEQIIKEEGKEKSEATPESTEKKKSSKLYRSRTNKMISGLSAGLAKELNMDVDLVRILWVIAFIITGGTALLVYLIMMIAIPLEPESTTESEKTEK
ncbi:MAG: PspC domain-containing protein [Asgard group archaeon]|nr:PspC domain-containing protein [Asgard group archaeon]